MPVLGETHSHTIPDGSTVHFFYCDVDNHGWRMGLDGAEIKECDSCAEDKEKKALQDAKDAEAASHVPAYLAWHGS